MKIVCCLFIVLIAMACRPGKRTGLEKDAGTGTIYADTGKAVPIDSPRGTNGTKIPVQDIQTITGVTRQELVGFAKTLIGIPYKYASTEPDSGFDCSGFITYVFNHFNIAVPRSSVDFTHVGKEISMENAMEADLVLFTGTNDSIRIVGHMGIVTENADSLKFIHSTSGRANGVTISGLTDYYKRRFVKIVRVFPD